MRRGCKKQQKETEMCEEYEKKEYVSCAKVEDVRKMYRTRYGLSDFAGKYSHARKFEKTNVMCRYERTREDGRHLMFTDCPVYADIRGQFSHQLVMYFSMVLAS